MQVLPVNQGLLSPLVVVSLKVVLLSSAFDGVFEPIEILLRGSGENSSGLPSLDLEKKLLLILAVIPGPALQGTRPLTLSDFHKTTGHFAPISGKNQVFLIFNFLKNLAKKCESKMSFTFTTFSMSYVLS